MRETIQTAAPEAIEKISYDIPNFALNSKNLAPFAAYEHHIGFYPGPMATKVFEHKLMPYNTANGTIQFPLDQPIPFYLVRTITKFCVE